MAPKDCALALRGLDWRKVTLWRVTHNYTLPLVGLARTEVPPGRARTGTQGPGGRSWPRAHRSLGHHSFHTFPVCHVAFRQTISSGPYRRQVYLHGCKSVYPPVMDTAQALKTAMDAVKAAGIPEELWATALPLALADLRGTAAPPTQQVTNLASEGGSASAQRRSKSAGQRRPTRKTATTTSKSPSTSSVVEGLPEAAELFEKVAAETEVSVDDLGDVFYVEQGKLHLKVIGKNLGENKKAATATVTALVGGVVFAGTAHTKVPFRDINALCKAKHVHDVGNGAAYIKATPGFAPVGSGANQHLVSKSGWQTEFSKAVGRVLGRTEPTP